MYNCTACAATNGCYYCNSPGPINRCWANSTIETCQYPNTSPGTNFQQKQTCSDPLSVFVNMNCSKFTNQTEWYQITTETISFFPCYVQNKNSTKKKVPIQAHVVGVKCILPFKTIQLVGQLRLITLALLYLFRMGLRNKYKSSN